MKDKNIYHPIKVKSDSDILYICISWAATKRTVYCKYILYRENRESLLCKVLNESLLHSFKLLIISKYSNKAVRTHLWLG